MIFQVRSNALVTALGESHELAALHEELTYDLGESRGRPNRLSLFDSMSRTFPIGLLIEAEASLRARGVSVLRNDFRQRPGGRRGLPLAWLLPHQREAVEAALRLGVACIDVPTSGGKGEILAAIVAEVPCDWLVLADDLKVLHQLGDPRKATKEQSGRIAWRSGEDPGLIGDGRFEDGRRVTVASPATLDQRWDGNRWDERTAALLARVRGVAYDEVHMAGSPRSQRILRSLAHCYYRLGFSGSVEGRSDKRDVVVRGQFGPVGYRVPAQELEAQGVIATQSVTLLRCDQPSTPYYDGGGYKVAVALSKPRNALVARVWQKERTGVLTFVREVDHGRYLLRVAEHLGLRAEFVHGECDSAERDAIQARFERGETPILIASDVWKQGADLIHVYAGINAAGGKSAIGTIQRRGRAGRVCRVEACQRCAEVGRKTSARWYDFFDLDSEAERVYKERRLRKPGLWLKRHTDLRVAAYRDKGIPFEVVSAP